MYNYNFWYSKRFFVAILTFFGQICSFALLANINIAMVEMTGRRVVVINNRTIIHDPEFNWDSRTRGLILGAHAYGGLLSILGGYLALKFGGSTMITIGSLISAILNLFNPMVVRYNFYLFWLIRALDGVAAVFKFVSISEMWSQWSPIQDLSKLIAIGFSGVYAGSSITYPLCGFVIHKFGWPAAFYFTGGIGLIWALVWFLLVPNDPSNDKWISKEELAYIKTNQKQTRPKNILTVWKQMIKSSSVLALGSLKSVYNFGFTVVVTFLPAYIEDITDDEIDEVGFLASIPNMVSVFGVPFIGYAMDAFQNKGILTTTQVHKLFLGIGFIGGSILLFMAAYFSSNIIISLACMTLFKIMLSLSFVVSQLVAISLAPQCASLVTGLIVIFYQVSAILSPMFVGFIVTDHNAAQWSICFCTVGIIMIIGAILFIAFGSSEPQTWSYSEDNSNNCHLSTRNKITSQL